MDKAFYKCATCVYHKVNLEEEKCVCILEKLNPKKKDLLYTIDEKHVVSGSFIGVFSGVGSLVDETTKHFHQWICFYHNKFLNCPGYKKDET